MCRYEPWNHAEFLTLVKWSQQHSGKDAGLAHRPRDHSLDKLAFLLDELHDPALMHVDSEEAVLHEEEDHVIIAGVQTTFSQW